MKKICPVQVPPLEQDADCSHLRMRHSGSCSEQTGGEFTLSHSILGLGLVEQCECACVFACMWKGGVGGLVLRYK